jgi:hypothetical protein
MIQVLLVNDSSVESQVSVKGKCCRRIVKKNDVVSINKSIDIQAKLGSVQAYHTISAKDEAIDDKCTLLRDLICACFGGASWHSDKVTRPLNMPC